MRKLSGTALALAALGFVNLAATSASALTYDLNVGTQCAGCSTGTQPFGTVTITQGVGGYNFDVVLTTPDYNFNANGWYCLKPASSRIWPRLYSVTR